MVAMLLKCSLTCAMHGGYVTEMLSDLRRVG